MSSEKQRYRMTFKCSEHGVFKKITTNADLKVASCPECRAEKRQARITKFTRLGDGPVPTTETKAEVSDQARVNPNTIYKCKSCSAITKIFEDVGETSLTECPACGSGEIQYRGKISHDTPTEAVMRNRAVDVTADIVMQDYKMGDLKDNVRVGEAMAPKLDPKRQMAADNMFGGLNKKNLPFNGAALAKKAMSGALRDRNYVDPVATIKPQFKPKISYVNQQVGKA